MFAARIAKPQAKTAGPSSDQSALCRPAVCGHERDIEQAQTSPVAPPPPGATWDFSKIPLYPPEPRDGQERPSPAPVPRLPGQIQRKLKVGAVNDPLEYEADRVADQVMRMPDPGVSVGIAPPQISRKFDACEPEEKPEEGEAGTQAAIGEPPSSVHEVLRAAGEPLHPATRAFFEPRFGHDLSSVRVHADEKAAQSARSIHAHAYTAGNDIVFGEGKFAPATEGRRLLAHELTHVLQQGGAARTVQRAPILAPATGATKPTKTKPGGPKAVSNSFNSYVDLFNGFQDLAAAAINRGGAGLDSARFGGDLSASHRLLLSRVRTVLILAQERDKEQRLAAAAAWPGLAAKLLAEVAEATRLHLPGEALAAVTDNIALLGRNYVHARAGKAEPEVESSVDYADTVHGMNELLWVFGHMGEAGEGLIREEVPNRKDVEVSSGVPRAERQAASRSGESGVRQPPQCSARQATADPAHRPAPGPIGGSGFGL